MSPNEQKITPGCEAMANALIDEFERSDADGAAGAMHHLDTCGQHLVDSVANDGVSLAAADFHDLPGTRRDVRDFARHALCDFAITKFA